MSSALATIAIISEQPEGLDQPIPSHLRNVNRFRSTGTALSRINDKPLETSTALLIVAAVMFAAHPVFRSCSNEAGLDNARAPPAPLGSSRSVSLREP
ncbi:hypothetical protein ABH922_003870 [Rhodococcus sp. 27YEA15]